MPTISSKPPAARVAAAALLLLGANGAALAGGTIEIDPKFEKFEGAAACDSELVRRYTAAVVRVANLPQKEQRKIRVDLLSNDDGRFTYVEWLDLTVERPDTVMPRSQTETFTCRGSTLEHRVEYESTGVHSRPVRQ